MSRGDRARQGVAMAVDGIAAASDGDEAAMLRIVNDVDAVRARSGYAWTLRVAAWALAELHDAYPNANVWAHVSESALGDAIVTAIETDALDFNSDK